ncbi:uncharacterized protein V2V93DRAFT_379746 [Kockiozyma suomiensis]|uniref:uncharacterized protein n=1 Tax=Kockiozyma suomiensis TaxID=1337062 RepID=UPI00334386F7
MPESSTLRQHFAVSTYRSPHPRSSLEMLTNLSNNFKQAWTKTVQELHEREARRRELQQQSRAKKHSAPTLASTDNQQPQRQQQQMAPSGAVIVRLATESKKRSAQTSNSGNNQPVVEKRRKVEPNSDSCLYSTVSPDAEESREQESKFSASLFSLLDPSINEEQRSPTARPALNHSFLRKSHEQLSQPPHQLQPPQKHRSQSQQDLQQHPERFQRRPFSQLEVELFRSQQRCQQLVNELRESQELVSRLSDLLHEQDEYIRAMEFDKSFKEYARLKNEAASKQNEVPNNSKPSRSKPVVSDSPKNNSTRPLRVLTATPVTVASRLISESTSMAEHSANSSTTKPLSGARTSSFESQSLGSEEPNRKLQKVVEDEKQILSFEQMSPVQLNQLHAMFRQSERFTL